ncbi:YqgE/AlgH family protein [Deinococcus sonorensis]|uniref:UPF0301 protein ABOD76_11740 n=2 Tax=Deinococcus sonorensis TaxID=309891 RepID=A0AAU7UEC3_9DEIO
MTSSSLQGPRLNYLVASPQVQGGLFEQGVILLLEHDDTGALGLLVNAQTQTPISELLPLAAGREELAWLGGPVEPHVGWCIYSDATGRDDELRLSDRLCVTSSLDVLSRLVEGEQELMLLLGYSGWSKGQLDRELREGTWLWVEAGPELVLEVPVADRWRQAVSLLGVDPAKIVRGAQA